MTELDSTDRTGISRRMVLAVGAAGASTMALAACSKAKTDNSAGPAASSTPGGTASSATAAGGTLAKLSDVAVGKAIAAKDGDGKSIIITRPTATTVVAFSAKCPHMGCTVMPSFHCPCHGSVYDPTTGARISGPAPTGLTKVNVAISGDSIVAG